MSTALAPAAPATPPAAPAQAGDPFVNALIRAGELGEQGAPMRDVALALAAAGWRVFPCDPRTKKPLVPHGFKGRFDDP